MGNCVGRMQQSAPLALPGDAAVEQSQAGEGDATIRSALVTRNRLVPTGLDELPRGHGTPPADVVPQRLGVGDLCFDVMTVIATKLDLDEVKTLRLTNKAFRAAGASRLTGVAVPAAEIGNMAQFFRDSTNICTLCITDKNNFGDQDLARLIEMLPRTGAKISRLDLSGCRRITDAGLGHLSGMNAMQTLNLFGCNKITDAGLGHLSGMTAMQALNLFGCSKITDTGLGHLSGMTAMQSLDLRYCHQITDTGLGHLSSMTAKISQLNLNGCHRITDAGLAHLTGMTAMQTLGLRGCMEITDAGLRHISRMATMQSLDLGCCIGISENRVMQLRARGIEVHWF